MMRRRPPGTALFLIAAAANGLILWQFHDRHWYPSDEGIYAHIAERLLAGDVMNRDVQNFHPGYIDFLNAAALKLFGMDLLSMRYPLVAGAFIQACLVYRLLSSRSVLLGAIASVSVMALGVVQFLNPSANWYCLFLTTALVCWMTWVPREQAARLIGAGLLIGVLALLRQLTGVWVMLGVLVVVLRERSTNAEGRGALLARTLLALSLGTLAAYIAFSSSAQFGGVILFAAWPVATLGLVLAHVRTTNRDAAVAVLQLGVGSLLGAVPLLIYLFTHASFSAWLDDAVFGAIGFARLPFDERGSWYAALPVAGLYQALSSLSLAKIVNGLYWSIVPLLASVNGILTIRRLRHSPTTEDLTLPIIAAFHGLVAMFMEDAIYLYFTAGMSLFAVLWLNASASAPKRAAWATVSAGLAVVGIVFHAAQSSLRTNVELLEGRPSRVGVTSDVFWRASLRLDPADRDPYRAVVERIRAQTGPDDTILALPSDSQFYFLANRRNPFRFYNSAVGIRTPGDLADVMETLTRQPPTLVTFRPADKYNTDASLTIVADIRQRYDLLEIVNGVEIYRITGARASELETGSEERSDGGRLVGERHQ